MGNYLASPISSKNSSNGSCARLRYGVSSMQGWRVSMEDAHLTRLNAFSLFPNMHIFAVFDGHGGPHVSRFAARHLTEQLGKSSAFREGRFEEALQDAFLLVDELLFKEEYQEELRLLSQERSTSLDSNDQWSAVETGPTDGNASTLPRSEEGCRSANPQLIVSEPNVNPGSPSPGKVSRMRFRAPNKNFRRNSRKDRREKRPQTMPPEKSEKSELRSKLSRFKNSMDLSKHRSASEDLQQNGAAPVSPAAGAGTFRRALTITGDSGGAIQRYGGRTDEGGFLTSIKNALSNVLSVGRQALWNPLAKSPNQIPSLAMLAGCTSIVTLVTDSELIVANAGDSRAVLCRDGVAVELSTDHKPNLPAEKTRIYCAGGFLEMGRVNGNLNLSRAIGDLIYKQDFTLPAEKQIVTAQPDTRIVEVSDKDEFLVIGCDGIWEKGDSSQCVIDFIRQRMENACLLTDIIEELFEELLSPNPAIFEHGCDNMTAMIVDLMPNRHNAAPTTAASAVDQDVDNSPGVSHETDDSESDGPVDKAADL